MDIDDHKVKETESPQELRETVADALRTVAQKKPDSILALIIDCNMLELVGDIHPQPSARAKLLAYKGDAPYVLVAVPFNMEVEAILLEMGSDEPDYVKACVLTFKHILQQNELDSGIAWLCITESMDMQKSLYGVLSSFPIEKIVGNVPLGETLH